MRERKVNELNVQHINFHVNELNVQHINFHGKLMN